MSYWNFLAPVLSLILGCYLLWAAYQRTNKKHKHVRAIVSLLAVSCLYLFYLNISTDKKHINDDFDEIIILTTGSSADTIRKLLSQNPVSKVYTTEPAIAAANSKSILVENINEIPGSEKTGTVKRIHILGYGLEENELNSLDNTIIYFHPPLITRHFSSISWNRQLNIGDKLNIQGTYSNNDHGDLDIILKGFNTVLDSTRISSDLTTSFQLQTIPKQNGRAVYTLLVLDGKDTIQQEKIPFETIRAAPTRILMLASSPDFENKFLKNWLFTNNYGVAIRTAMSLNKFNTEYLNLTGIKADRINSNLLNNFDLVIGDATALNKLSGIELNSIRTAVQQDGLGLIIKVDSITRPSLFFNEPFHYIQSGSIHNQLLHLQIADTNATMPALTATRPMFISNMEQLRPIISDKEGHLFSASAVSGNGKLLSTTIANTYNWVLTGDTMAYSQYWSDLISETSKTLHVPDLYSIDPLISYADMRAVITVESADSLPFQARVNRSLIPLNQQFILPFQWKGTYWPRKTGWQNIVSNDNQSYYWYIFAKSDWNDLLAAKKIAANKIKLSQSTNKEISNETDVENDFQRYARIYIILMFVICCTYLWIEEKFHNSR
jgi:hypothetical protein